MPEYAGRLPDAVIACVGGGSNAMGIFYPYIPHAERAADRRRGRRARASRPASTRASLSAGRPGVLHGNRTYLLQDEDGQIIETHSISAGLDYPGVGPEHAWLKDSGRARVRRRSTTTRRSRRSTTAAASKASSRRSSRRTRSRTRRSSRRRCRKDKILLVNLSGRGDKDMNTVAERSGLKFYCRPECNPAMRDAACRRIPVPPLSCLEPHRRHLRAPASRRAAPRSFRTSRPATRRSRRRARSWMRSSPAAPT